VRGRVILRSSQRAALLFISGLAALFVAAPAALAIARRVFHRWDQYRAGIVLRPPGWFAAAASSSTRLRRVLEEAATSQKMAVGDNRGSSKD
jgi:hypothetical protein